MTDTWRLARLGSWLRLFAALIFTGTIAELLATGHYETRAQLIPFVLCGAGLAVLLLEWRWPRPALTRLLLGTMAVVGAGSLVGVAFHLQSNLQSVLERQPELTGLALGLAMVAGRNPFGAPGMLAVGALIAGAAVYAGRQPVSPRRAWARPARAARTARVAVE